MDIKTLLSLGILLLTLTLAQAGIDTREGKQIHIAFAANNEVYLTGAGVGAVSVMEHAYSEDFYHFHVYTTDALAEEGLTEAQAEAWQAFENTYPNCLVEIVPVETIPLEEKMDFKHWGKAAVIRILLPELLPNEEKVIYMDCDMIALQDMAILDQFSNAVTKSDIYHMIASHNWGQLKLASTGDSISAIQDINSEYQGIALCGYFGFCEYEKDEYINSGLLIMNLDALRKSGFAKKALTWLANHPSSRLPDQDAINAVCKGNIKILDFAYAYPSFWNEVQNPVIVHYLSKGAKPWNNPEAARSDLFFSILEKSPWKDLLEIQSSSEEYSSYGYNYPY